jgi:hypothetical protein
VLINDTNGLTINGNGSNDVITLVYANNTNPLPNILHLNGTFTVNNLTGANPFAGTIFEIGQSTVFISYAGPTSDPILAIKSYLQTGFNNGAWNGTATPSTGAITSTAAAASPAAFSVGNADYGDGMNVNTVVNTVELRYTALGDTNLDRTVGLADYNAVVRNFGTGTTWDRGVVTYDGSVGLADYNAVVRNFGNTAPATIAAAANASRVAGSGTTAPSLGWRSRSLLSGVNAVGPARHGAAAHLARTSKKRK